MDGHGFDPLKMEETQPFHKMVKGEPTEYELSPAHSNTMATRSLSIKQESYSKTMKYQPDSPKNIKEEHFEITVMVPEEPTGLEMKQSASSKSCRVWSEFAETPLSSPIQSDSESELDDRRDPSWAPYTQKTCTSKPKVHCAPSITQDSPKKRGRKKRLPAEKVKRLKQCNSQICLNCGVAEAGLSGRDFKFHTCTGNKPHSKHKHTLEMVQGITGSEFSQDIIGTRLSIHRLRQKPDGTGDLVGDKREGLESTDVNFFSPIQSESELDDGHDCNRSSHTEAILTPKTQNHYIGPTPQAPPTKRGRKKKPLAEKGNTPKCRKPWSHLCDACGKAFISGRDLRRHVHTHTGDKPFSCSECRRRFNDRGNMLKHTRVHSGIQPYTCADCGKAFSERGNLQRHERLIHTTGPRHICGNCGRSYKEKGSLDRHVRSNLCDTKRQRKEAEVKECTRSELVKEERTERPKQR